MLAHTTDNAGFCRAVESGIIKKLQGAKMPRGIQLNGRGGSGGGSFLNLKKIKVCKVFVVYSFLIAK